MLNKPKTFKRKDLFFHVQRFIVHLLAWLRFIMLLWSQWVLSAYHVISLSPW